MCLCRTKAHFSKEDNKRILTLDPVDIEFDGLSAKIQTVITFEEGSSRIDYRREILEISSRDKSGKKRMSREEKQKLIVRLTEEMKAAAKILEFEHAAYLRDRIEKLRRGK